MEFEAIETIVQPKKVASGQLHASLKVYKNASNKLLMDGIRMKTCMSVEWWYSLEKKKVMLDEKKNVRRVNQCCILVKCVAILSIAKFHWKTSIPLFFHFIHVPDCLAFAFLLGECRTFAIDVWFHLAISYGNYTHRQLTTNGIVISPASQIKHIFMEKLPYPQMLTGFLSECRWICVGIFKVSAIKASRERKLRRIRSKFRVCTHTFVHLS